MQPSDNERDTDFLGVMKQRHEEFIRRLSQSKVHDIVGVVSALGASGGRSTSEDWALILFFARWRLDGSPIQTAELRIEMPVSEEGLSARRAQIRAYDILHVRGRVAEYPARGMQAYVEEIVSVSVNDPELEAHAEELQKPVVLENSRFGTLTLDRRVNWFCGSPLWAGRRIRLNLSMADCDSIERPLAVATALWDSEMEWNTKIIDYAANSLLSLKNDVWLQEDEAELSAADFKKRISLESIVVYPDGRFEFWYDDGDLFWGHAIVISGSLADGLDDAGIHG